MKVIEKTILYDRAHEILIELGELELAFDLLVAKRKRMELDFYLSKGRDEYSNDTEICRELDQ